MPRRIIPFAPGSTYHIYNRGNNRQAIFFQSENYLYFLKGVRRYLLPVVDVIAYCLMPTHYHLLVMVKDLKDQTSEVLLDPEQTSEVLKTSEVSVSKAMMRLSVSYTKAINKRFSRTGSLFQGAFRAEHISNSKHLLQLCRYIHVNPVKDGLVSDPGDWPYSNYLEWIVERDGKLIDRAFVQSQFSSVAEYHDFVFDYLRSRKLPADIQLYLNSLED
jgi:putative transposase